MQRTPSDRVKSTVLFCDLFGQFVNFGKAGKSNNTNCSVCDPLRMLQVGAGRRKCKEASEIHKFSTKSNIEYPSPPFIWTDHHNPPVVWYNNTAFSETLFGHTTIPKD